MSESTYRKSVTPSGITLVTETVAGRRSVALGVWVSSGARDEPFERLGISHFIEHMMFKGTERRDARAIAQSLESLGGHLDAFTAREQVCYFARALSEHLEPMVDVVSDIVCYSRFAPREVEREKSVVREEIFACEDDPEDKVNTLRAYAPHPRAGGRPPGPWLGGGTGGLSGPAVRAVALAQVRAVAARVAIPVVGMGGVQTGRHALQLLEAGATLVAVGTESFRDAAAAERIRRELHDLFAKSGDIARDHAPARGVSR